jgi:hypothetical protein
MNALRRRSPTSWLRPRDIVRYTQTLAAQEPMPQLSPTDGDGIGAARPLAVLGLNMIKSPGAAARAGQREMVGWLRGVREARRSTGTPLTL